MQSGVPRIQPAGNHRIALRRHQQCGAQPAQGALDSALPGRFFIFHIDQFADKHQLLGVQIQCRYQLIAQALVGRLDIGIGPRLDLADLLNRLA